MLIATARSTMVVADAGARAEAAERMAQWIAVGLAILVGMVSTLQVAMLAAMGRGRGPAEGVWVSMLGTLTGLAILVLLSELRLLRGGPTLAKPFDRPLVLVSVIAIAGMLLTLAVQGNAPGFAMTGLLALPFLFGATVLGPRLGIGLFLGAVIAGQLIAGVVFDHYGFFGAPPHPIDLTRVIGVAALLIGVALIRGVK